MESHLSSSLLHRDMPDLKYAEYDKQDVISTLPDGQAAVVPSFGYTGESAPQVREESKDRSANNFSTEKYKENQTFLMMQKNDPQLHSKIINDLKQKKTHLSTRLQQLDSQNISADKAVNEIKRELWVIEGVLDH